MYEQLHLRVNEKKTEVGPVRHSEAGLNRILTVDYFDASGFPRLA